MRLLLLLLGVLYFNTTQGQDSTAYQTQETHPSWLDSTFFTKSNAHSPAREGYVASVCVSLLSKKNCSSCIYFYTPSQNIKAKGKQDSTAQKIGKWSYFYENGKRCGIAHFSSTGKKKGVWKYYKIDGSIDRIIYIKNEEFGMLFQKGKLKSKVPMVRIMEPFSIESQ